MESSDSNTSGMSDGPQFDAAGRDGRVPVAGLLFDGLARPSVADMAAMARNGAFAIAHRDDRGGGVEMLRDGLSFDCRGLAPGRALRCGPAVQTLDLPAEPALTDLAMVALGPAGHLAGAASLLPVVRMLGGLLVDLCAAAGLRAVVWLPARLAVSPAWFAQSVGAWLGGGPFPALALTALSRGDRGFVSQGLGFFTSQEFVMSRPDGGLRETDARGAVRLIDWLVAHGRVDAPCEVDLIGFGAVGIAPDGRNGLNITIL